MSDERRLVVIPVILTLDEAPNIARVLKRLYWAPEVLVVDSGSTDGTCDIAREFDNVCVIEHRFENFESQWNFAVEQARARSPWVLALDADYVLGDEFIAAVTALRDPPPADAFRATFRYCVLGRLLRGSLYPAKVVLFHADKARYVQRGHTQMLELNGSEASLAGHIFHDDRKSQARWLRSQVRYAREEAAMIDSARWHELPWSGRIRKLLVVAAPAAFVLSMFWRGGILDGLPGLFYAMQRSIAELLIAMALIERRLAADSARDPR